jgi:hypothetical protein
VLRPDVGSKFNTPARNKISMIASQKLGMLMPKRPKVVPRLSTHELGLEPAHTPSGIARRVAMIIAKIASSMVAGSRVFITLTTGSAYLNDLPKSPTAADLINLKY